MVLKSIQTACVFVVAGLFTQVQAQEVTGAGATFPAPLYAKWAALYEKATSTRINYQSVGSGAGLKQIRAKTVDFGASDMPLKDEELKADSLVQFPTVVGGVVPVFNIPGVASKQLRLSGAVLADIYLGKITQWSDPALVALNPGVKLPEDKIAVVRRADGSGTSFIWTNYLSKSSPEWKEKVGEGTAVNWPVGLGGKGNEGVAAYVQRLPLSIGYVEYAYAKANKISYAVVRNSAGKFVEPDESSFQAAADSADWSKSFYQILTNQAGANAWPISGATFIILQRVQEKPAQGAAALKFFDWAYDHGAQAAGDLDYVSLPPSVVKTIRSSWAQIQDANGKAVYTR